MTQLLSMYCPLLSLNQVYLNSTIHPNLQSYQSAKCIFIEIAIFWCYAFEIVAPRYIFT